MLMLGSIMLYDLRVGLEGDKPARQLPFLFGDHRDPGSAIAYAASFCAISGRSSGRVTARIRLFLPLSPVTGRHPDDEHNTGINTTLPPDTRWISAPRLPSTQTHSAPRSASEPSSPGTYPFKLQAAGSHVKRHIAYSVMFLKGLPKTNQLYQSDNTAT